MSDLISRQDAIALIKLEMHERKTPFTSMEVGFWHGMIFCIEALTNMPSADTDAAKEYLGRRILAEFEKP